MKLLFLLIGMVLVLEGLPYAAAPELMQSWLKKLGELHPRELRIFGLITVFCGLILCWGVERWGGS
jgi:uncharacterized protein